MNLAIINKNTLGRNGFLIFLLLFTSQISAQTYTPGNTYFDPANHVEYLAGNLPIILSAPHGGGELPDSIPDRECDGCVLVRDGYTKKITQDIKDALYAKTGCYPHVIVNLLHRRKFDANRDIGDAADGNAQVEKAWYYYHKVTDSAKAKVTRDYGKGLYLDIHGHGHPLQRLEIGNGIWKSDLQKTDTHLNGTNALEKSSIRNLAADNIKNLSHAQLIRGDFSFGTLMDAGGYPSVPSSTDSFPLDTQYFFSGGYNTLRHGSRDAGTIDAIQVECNSSWRFESDIARKVFSDSIAEVIIDYIGIHYFTDFKEKYCNLSATIQNKSLRPKFTVSPNPAQNEINITTDLKVIAIAIYNTMGKELLNQQWKDKPIDIRILPNGLYFIVISTSENQKYSTIIIKK